MNLRTTLFFTLIFLISITSSSLAQDPRFSQFYASPLQLNPAMTGVFEGQMRFAVNYRDQWSSILGSVPFRTVAASVDYRKYVAGGDYASIGLALLQDQAGVSHFRQTKGNLGFSYLKRLAGGGYGDGDQYLIAGAQVGAGQHSLDWGDLWFSRQYNPNTESVDLTAPSGEIQQNNSELYMDINAGVLWYALMGDNTSIYAGGALFHINGPNVSFFDNADEILYMRWIAHAGGELPITRQLSFLPAVAVMSQGPSMEIDFGGNFRYTNHDWREIAIRAGLWNRLANKLDNGIEVDALIVTAILELDAWNLGISYDINTSSLIEASNTRGAFEVSLIYTTPEKRRSRVKCPNF